MDGPRSSEVSKTKKSKNNSVADKRSFQREEEKPNLIYFSREQIEMGYFDPPPDLHSVPEPQVEKKTRRRKAKALCVSRFFVTKEQLEAGVLVDQPRRRPRTKKEQGVDQPGKRQRTKKDQEVQIVSGKHRIAEGPAWCPPPSPHQLIQESLYDQPWRMLIACMLLNRTTGRQMHQVIDQFFNLCPTPEAALVADVNAIRDIIRPLGFGERRPIAIKRFSEDFLYKEWKDVSELHGIGKYGKDAYLIFYEGRWKDVKPTDHKLNDYWTWLWEREKAGVLNQEPADK